MATKHSASFDGIQFKRVSQNRVYPFLVVVEVDVAADRERTERNARCDYRLNLDYYKAKAAGSVRYLGKNSWENDEAYEVRRSGKIAEAQGRLDAGEEGAVARALAKFDARLALAKNLSSDGKRFIGEAGWCSRPDLAQKLRNSSLAKGYYCRAHVVPTVIA